MSDAATTTRRWELRAYHESDEHHALRMAREAPEAVVKPLPEPVSVARQQLAQMVALDGYVIDLTSVREESREAVIVNEAGDDYRRAQPGESPTGHIVLWSCTGHERRGSDADDPVLTGYENDGVLVFEVPADLRAVGGSARLRHGLGGEVTALARTEEGEGIGYLFATTLDPDTVHIEFFAGTAAFHVTADKP